MRRFIPLLLTLACFLCVADLAYAQEAATPTGVPGTGSAMADDIMRVIGALTVLLTALANILPKSWKLTQLAARTSVDLKGIGTKR